QGLATAYAQIVAEELDTAVDRVSVVMGRTDLTPDQGGTGASTGVRAGARPLRHAAAELRRLLVNAAASRMGRPVDELTVEGGVVRARDEGGGGGRVSYGELVGDGPFAATLAWIGET